MNSQTESPEERTERYMKAREKVLETWGSLTKAQKGWGCRNLEMTLRGGTTICPHLQRRLRAIGVYVRLVPRGSAWRGVKALQVANSRKTFGRIPDDVLARGVHCFAFIHGREDLWVLYPKKHPVTGLHLLRRSEDGLVRWDAGPLYFAHG